MEDNKKSDNLFKDSIPVIPQDFLDTINEIGRMAAEAVAGFSEAITKIKFPEIELPKFKFPHIDYTRIRTIICCNSKSGWTLTGEMGLGDYLNDDLLTYTQEEIDAYFLTYYKYKNDELKINNYELAKNSILETVNPKWIETVVSSFKCYDLDMYKMTIPNLLMIIEGEISEIADSDLVGGKLLTHWKKELDTESDKFDAMALYSLYLFLREVLFKTRDFHKKRLDIINRNWILHGRDDPTNWKEQDYFRLINTLSSVQYIKRLLKNDWIKIEEK
ncbi:hypothetical protein [Neobacillus dielmonensis]|uniref:hypothetical protein n=1 Tax=Neobacillus dielmonensis TaxID=1347369 RepID=UPI0005AA1A2A|nr:hypothetical protein [Neobacillus dielmonensis]